MESDRIGAAHRDECSPSAEGRVLRVKQGYNPNSSSVGSALPTYIVFAAASGALTALLLHVTGSVATLLRGRKAGPRGAAPASEPASGPSSSLATEPTDTSPSDATEGRATHQDRPERTGGAAASEGTPEPTDAGRGDHEPLSEEQP